MKGVNNDLVPAQFNVPREIKAITPVSDLRSLRVMSWNIDRGYHLDQVANTLLHESTDLCLLQEVDWGTTRVAGADVGAELARRVALVTDLEFAGQPLIVYNAHLESRSYGRIQMEQLNEMLADLNSHYPPNTAAIIGGDLNTKYLPSIFLHKLERDGFRSSTGERIERSHTIAMALDWIFVRGPVHWESGAVRKDWKGSDHYPVYAELVTSR